MRCRACSAELDESDRIFVWAGDERVPIDMCANGCWIAYYRSLYDHSDGDEPLEANSDNGDDD